MSATALVVPAPAPRMMLRQALFFLISGVLIVLALGVARWTTATVSLGCLLGSFWLMQKTVDVLDLRRLSISGFWYLYFVATLFIPAHFVYVAQEGAYTDRYLFAIRATALLVPLGCLLAATLLGSGKNDLRRFLDKPMETGRSGVSEGAFRLLLLFALGLTALYMVEVGEIPLLSVLRNPGDAALAADLRAGALKELDSPLTYWYHLLRNIIYPYLLLVSMGLWLAVGSRKRLTLIVVLLSALLYASLTVEKSPVVILFLLLLLYYYLHRRGAIRKSLGLALAAGLLAFPLFIVVLTQDVDAWVLLAWMGLRVFYGPANDLYFYFEVFPAYHPYVGLATSGKLAWLAGEETVNVPNYVGLYHFPNAPDYIHENAAFVGELLAGFGLGGVILGSLAAGVVISALQIAIIRRPKTILTLALYVFQIYVFMRLNQTSLLTILGSYGALLVFGLAWLLSQKLRPSTARRLAHV